MATAVCYPNGNGATNDFSYVASNALDFDGSNDRVEIADAAWNDFGAGNFTVECWVMKKANSSGWSNVAAVGKWNTGGSPGTNEWLIALTTTGSNQKFSFTVEVGSTSYAVNSTTTISLNTWYHVAGVRNGTSIMLYVNGALEGTTTNAGITTINNIAGREIMIGKIDGFAGHTNMKFGNLRIWGVARTLSEIAANRFIYSVYSQANLLASYTFDQGVAAGTNTGLTTLTDSSGNGRNGTLFNFALTGSTSNWVLFNNNANSNWTAVKDYFFDETYTKCTTAATVVDLYAVDYGPLPAGAVISSVVVTAIARMVSSGSVTSATAIIRIGSTNYNVNTTLFSNYGYVTINQTFNTNPATGTAWTYAALIAAQIGFRCTITAGGEARVSQCYITITYTLPTYNNQIFFIGI